MASTLSLLVVLAALCLTNGASVSKKRNFLKILKKSAAPAPKSGSYSCTQSSWKQINHIPVCFEGQGNKYGHMNHLGAKGLVGAIKLVYRSGHIRCTTNPAYDSRWGCYHYSTFMKYPLNIIITDKHNNIIFPKQRYIKHTSGLWYYMPMVDDKHSDELVFSDFNEPFYLGQYDEMRLWYGEDLKNWSETDNQGRVCVDVYARFV